MRIALVHFSYLPVIGGVELILAAHARLFTEAGHRVTVLCKRGTSDDPRICVELVSEEAEGMARMRELLGASEIVFLHNVLTMPFAPRWTEALGRLAAELPHVRFVSWIHDLAACNPDYSVPGESLLRKAHPGMKHVAISAHRQREFEALTGEPCRVIPNGINPAATLGLSGKIAELATDYQLYERDLVLFHPARLLRRKNIEFSLQVTSALLARGCDCILIVTGPADAQNIATRSQHQTVDVEHVALALLEQEGGLVARLFEKAQA
ncbi:MAG: Clp protease N-terminal domain-containing protein, partial [Verrucomicrobiota bacterium]